MNTRTPRHLPRPPSRPSPRPTQEMAVGRSVDHSVALELGGFAGAYMPGNPDCMLSVLCGRAGQGKSSLIQSNPRAVVLCPDVTSTPRRSRAVIIPGINSQGLPVRPSATSPEDPDSGEVIDIDWPLMLASRDAILRLHKEDRLVNPVSGDKITMVALDTVDTAAKLLQRWMVDEWNRQHPDNVKEAFDELDGRTAWPEYYEHMLDFGLSFRRAGLGFTYILWLGDKTMSSDGKSWFLTDVPLVQPNLWNTLIGRAEMVMAVRLQERLVGEKQPVIDAAGRQAKGKDGKPLTRTVAAKEFDLYLSFEQGVGTTGKTAKDTKKRFGRLPSELKLPKTNAWETFRDAVIAAVNAEQANAEP